MSTLQFFNTYIWHLSKQQISNERLLLFQLINGDIFYPIRTWPLEMQLLFWNKPTSDKDSFRLMLFLIGNGCPPNITAKWILSSQHWAPHKKGEKGARQIDFVTRNLESKANVWYYFDLQHNQWLYLNGDRREHQRNL